MCVSIVHNNKSNGRWIWISNMSFDRLQARSFGQIMNEISTLAEEFLMNECCNFSHTIYATLIQRVRRFLESCTNGLRTHSDIAIARFAELEKGPCHNDPHTSWEGIGLASPLLQLLQLCTRLWFSSISRNLIALTLCHPSANSSNIVVANSIETNILLETLDLHYNISHMDCVLGEEIVRAGSHILLSQLIHFNLQQEASNVSSSIVIHETDMDAIFDIQDRSCSITRVTVFLHTLPFPMKPNPFTLTELEHRLPMAFQFHTTLLLSPSNTWERSLSWDPSMYHQTMDSREEKNLLWIQHITHRQSAQVDVGFVTWPSSVALAHWILNHSDWLQNRMIVEIGAGTGLVGLVAAKILQQSSENDQGIQDGQVILTDYNRHVVDNLRRNVLLNGLETYAKTSCLDFYNHDGTNYHGGWVETMFSDLQTCYLCPRDAVDIVLAADVICQPSDSISLSKTIYDLLKPGGKAMISLASAAHRFGVEIFQTECEQRGLSVAITRFIPEGRSNVYSATSGYVDGMEIYFYEISKSLIA